MSRLCGSASEGFVSDCCKPSHGEGTLGNWQQLYADTYGRLLIISFCSGLEIDVPLWSNALQKSFHPDEMVIF